MHYIRTWCIDSHLRLSDIFREITNHAATAQHRLIYRNMIFSVIQQIPIIAQYVLGAFAYILKKTKARNFNYIDAVSFTHRKKHTIKKPGRYIPISNAWAIMYEIYWHVGTYRYCRMFFVLLYHLCSSNWAWVFRVFSHDRLSNDTKQYV